MPRRNRGPRLVPIRKKNHAEAYWYVRWYEDGRKRERATGVPCSQPAPQEALTAHVERVTARPDGPRHPHEILIADVLALYGEEHAPHTADPARIGYCIAALLPFWGELPVSAIKKETCRRYGKQRQAGPGTVRRELGCLSAALRYCVAEGYLISAPIVTMPERPGPKDRWLTRQEVAAILWAARKEKRARHLVLFILIGIYTGARKGSILSLRWTQNTEGGWIDLEHERIDFNPVGRAQTKKRRPVVPIPKRLLRFLRYAHERRECDYVISYNGEKVGKLRHSFATAARNAGVEGVSEHVLRHTVATWYAQRGISTRQAADFLGMTIRTYETVYYKKHPDYMEEARRALD